MYHRETVWTFETRQFRVTAYVTPDYGYQYDGDDENGEVQTALDNGEMVAFDTDIIVTHKPTGVELGSDHLGGSVYYATNWRAFFTDHRSPNPLHRNCTIMRAAHGGKAGIGHYFPGMVSEAVKMARKTLASLECVDWPKVEAAVAEKREEKLAEIRNVDPDYVQPAPRCDRTSPKCNVTIHGADRKLITAMMEHRK